MGQSMTHTYNDQEALARWEGLSQIGLEILTKSQLNKPSIDYAKTKAD
jgi:hypothetical protein